MTKQLELSKVELEAIGFKENFSPADEMNAARDYYTIPVINGEFIYNVNQETYRWYLRTSTGEASNSVWLNIERAEELYMVLSCFRVKFNMLSFLSRTLS